MTPAPRKLIFRFVDPKGRLMIASLIAIAGRFDLLEMVRTQTRNPIAVVTGVGGIWTVNDRLAIYGSYNFGLTQFSPTTLAFLGFAVAL